MVTIMFEDGYPDGNAHDGHGQEDNLEGPIEHDDIGIASRVMGTTRGLSIPPGAIRDKSTAPQEPSGIGEEDTPGSLRRRQQPLPE